MPKSKSKTPRTKSFVLLTIIFFHLLPVIASAFYDKSLIKIKHGIDVSLAKPGYWLWFFTWWSAWTSLLTIPWALYKLGKTKNKASSFGEQVIDLTVVETNLLSGVIFCGGGFLLTWPKYSHQTLNFPGVGGIKMIYVYLFYNLFWHILAPALVVYYWGKHGQTDQLRKKPSKTLVANLFNPTGYFFYLLGRAQFSDFAAKNSTRLPRLPYKFPRDYPYAPFFWSVGKKSSHHTRFWYQWPTWSQVLFWWLIIFAFWYLIFSLLFYVLVKIKK